jgi:hypothetical protein
MTRVLAVFALGLVLAATPAWSADDAANKAAPARPAAVKKSMAPDGSFHTVHTKKLELACDTCHKSENKDVLFVRNTEAPPAGLKAHVDRNGCLVCHKDPRKPTWYK